VTSGSGVNAVIHSTNTTPRGRQTAPVNQHGRQIFLVSTLRRMGIPKGRPPTAIVSSKASDESTFNTSSDEALRTMTTTNPVGVQIETYDADGKTSFAQSRTDGGGKKTSLAFKAQ
jgi:hypothetical protein